MLARARARRAQGTGTDLDFPDPSGRTGRAPWWERADIERWKAAEPARRARAGRPRAAGWPVTDFGAWASTYGQCLAAEAVHGADPSVRWSTSTNAGRTWLAPRIDVDLIAIAAALQEIAATALLWSTVQDPDDGRAVMACTRHEHPDWQALALRPCHAGNEQAYGQQIDHEAAMALQHGYHTP